MNWRKAFLLLRMLGVMLSLPLSAAHAEGGAITTWAELQAALNAGGEVTLTDNITAGADDVSLYVPTDVTVTLGLAGKTIDRNLESHRIEAGYDTNVLQSLSYYCSFNETTILNITFTVKEGAGSVSAKLDGQDCEPSSLGGNTYRIQIPNIAARYKNMKKICFLLILALLLSPAASAFAEGGVEILVMDGIPVVVESFGFEMSDRVAFGAAADNAGFMLPGELAAIGEEAFAGIPASRVEITENVKEISPRAFADCQNLIVLVIPATVETIDDTTLAGSTNVTVYGEIDSEAHRFASDNGIPFVAANAPAQAVGEVKSPVVMPYVAF